MMRLAVAVVFAAVALVVPAAAQSDATIQRGEEITVSGGGWQGGSQVTISGRCISESTADVDDQGNFSAPVRIADDAPEGNCTVSIEGQGTDGQDRTVEQRVTVAAAEAQPEPTPTDGAEPAAEESPTPAATPAGGEPIADTGIDSGTGLLLALALLLGGAGAVVLSRATRRPR